MNELPFWTNLESLIEYVRVSWSGSIAEALIETICPSVTVMSDKAPRIGAWLTLGCRTIKVIFCSTV